MKYRNFCSSRHPHLSMPRSKTTKTLNKTAKHPGKKTNMSNRTHNFSDIAMVAMAVTLPQCVFVTLCAASHWNTTEIHPQFTRVYSERNTTGVYSSDCDNILWRQWNERFLLHYKEYTQMLHYHKWLLKFQIWNELLTDCSKLCRVHNCTKSIHVPLQTTGLHNRNICSFQHAAHHLEVGNRRWRFKPLSWFSFWSSCCMIGRYIHWEDNHQDLFKVVWSVHQWFSGLAVPLHPIRKLYSGSTPEIQ